MDDLIILGAGGLAQEYAWLVEEINESRPTFNLLGYVDDSADRAGLEYQGYPVLGPLEVVADYPEASLIVGVGDPEARYDMVQQVQGFGNRWANLISPTVRLHPSNVLGHGVMIGRYTDLTLDCRIGNHVMINIHVVLGHAVEIGDYSVVSPNTTINGEARVGTGVYVGANAFVRNVEIGDWSTIGGGSAVVKAVAPGHVMGGVPAKTIREGRPRHTLTQRPTPGNPS
jgi:sugar O-acyltransferase (sialic acid O-acetyltransferase NeuD family)